MERDKEFDELLRRKISDTLGEQIDDSIDADDLMFDLGMRYLRLMAAEKKKTDSKKAHQLSLWSENAVSKKALIDYVDSVTDRKSPDYIPLMDRIAVFDFGWIPISMKHDWLTVFGDGVTKKCPVSAAPPVPQKVPSLRSAHHRFRLP